MTAKQDSERLINGILPLAENMLRRYGEFYPYGGYMQSDGTIIDVGAQDSNTDHPKARDLIDVLKGSFREMAWTNRCKAVAIVFDVAVNLPKSNLKTNAIQVCVEHREAYSAEVFFPYQIINNQIVYGETFAQEGKHEIFGQGSQS